MSDYKDCVSCMIFNAKSDVRDAIADTAVAKEKTLEEIMQQMHEEWEHDNDLH